MSLPGVSIAFSDGNLGISAGGSLDSVFLVIGPSSLGQNNTVYTITDPNSIAGLIGFGEGPEVVAQILNVTGTVVYFVPGTQSVSVTPIGSISQSRAGAPTMVATYLLGLPGQFFAQNTNNTGSGAVRFDTTTAPQLSSSSTTASLVVTTAGPLGTAVATITIGSTVHTSQTLGVAPWTDPGATGVVLDFVTPLGGRFELGDSFTAAGTPNDNYNVLITIQSISAQGIALWTYSLDGGVTTSGTLVAALGATVSATGATTPALTIAGSAPSTNHVVTIAATQAGTAYGVAAQCSTSSGLMTRVGTGLATSTVTGVGTSGSESFTAVQAYVLTVSVPGATGTATGYWKSNGVAVSGGGTSGSPITLATTFTDSTTGVVFTLASGPGNFVAGDTYSITIQPQAIMLVTVDGVAGSPTSLASTGVVALGFSGPTATFAHSNADIFSYSSTAPSATSTYSFNVYPSFSYRIAERNGSLVGLNLAFGFGTYQPGDQFAFATNGPYIAPTDATTALQDAIATTGIAFSMAHFACVPASFSVAATIAADVATVLNTLALAPAWRFVRGLIYGPSLPSSVAGATPAAFTAATGSLALNRAAMTCGADYITSALTQRRDLRNMGVVATARLALVPVQVDVGAVGSGALTNDVSTTTTLNDATSFNANRGITSVTYSGLLGVYANQGNTLAAPNSDYSSIENCRVIDKAAYYGRLSLLQRVNGLVRMVPGTGTIDPRDANTINAGTKSAIQVNCQGNFQDVFVACSLTQNVLSTKTEPVTISVLPFAYLTNIDVTIGFTLGAA